MWILTTQKLESYKYLQKRMMRDLSVKVNGVCTCSHVQALSYRSKLMKKIITVHKFHNPPFLFPRKHNWSFLKISIYSHFAVLIWYDEVVTSRKMILSNQRAFESIICIWKFQKTSYWFIQIMAYYSLPCTDMWRVFGLYLLALLMNVAPNEQLDHKWRGFKN